MTKIRRIPKRLTNLIIYPDAGTSISLKLRPELKGKKTTENPLGQFATYLHHDH